jgi:hypothetical protein
LFLPEVLFLCPLDSFRGTFLLKETTVSKYLTDEEKKKLEEEEASRNGSKDSAPQKLTPKLRG